MQQVTVIIPVYNNEQNLNKCLSALKKQNYDQKKIKIIVVDNQSTDKSREVAKKFGAEILIQSKMKSPYPSRNMGIRASKTEYLMLLDSNCFAEKNAIRYGLTTLIERKLDFCAPKINFCFSEKADIYEYLDSLIFIDTEDNAIKGVIPATCIFCKKNSFEMHGYFPEYLRSNGDTVWSKMASENGAKIGFSKDSIFFYPAKSKKKLLKKCRRIGRGNKQVWIKNGNSYVEIFFKALWNMRPDSLESIRNRIDKRGEEWMKKKVLEFWIARWAMKINRGIGRLGF